MPAKTAAPQKPPKCKNCGRKFTPTADYPVQLFCQTQCRMEFHRNGPVNRAQIKTLMRKIAAEEAHAALPRTIAAQFATIESRLSELERMIKQ